MSFLVDTNVISEVRKGARCDPHVATWWAGVADDELWMSAIVLGEVRKGVELARRRDPQKADVLDAWIAELTANFADRILPIDASVADAWGRISAIRPTPVIDTLIAATAMVHGLTLVTRNDADVAGLGVAVFNPFGPVSRK